MKNIILSLIVVGGLVLVGYYFLGSDKSNLDGFVKVNLNTSENAGYATMTEAENNSNTATAINVTLTDETPNPKILEQKKEKYMITIETNYGKIVFETYNSDAPKTVENFVTLAGKGFYNGLIFHRVINGFMIQGGDPNGNGMGGPGYKFEDELNPNTASYKAGYKKGVIAMANAGPNTNGSQFFIMHEDYPLPNNYTIFGKVVSGLDVVDKIANVETGVDDRPVTPVVMSKVTVQ